MAAFGDSSGQSEKTQDAVQENGWHPLKEEADWRVSSEVSFENFKMKFKLELHLDDPRCRERNFCGIKAVSCSRPGTGKRRLA